MTWAGSEIVPAVDDNEKEVDMEVLELITGSLEKDPKAIPELNPVRVSLASGQLLL